jgi:hypothetical protein
MNTQRLLPAVLIALFVAGGAASRAGAVDAKTVRENAASSDDSLDGRLTLFFRDAVTGLALSSADVTLEGATAATDAGGKVTFPFPKVSEEDDQTVVAEVSKKGYITSKVPLLFRLGMIFDVHYSISPTLPADNLRFVVDWGEEPADLDAHLVKQGAYHVSYRDSHDVANEARLDHDAKYGFGPETITLKHLDPAATFVFYVHDFTDRGDKTTWKLGQSHAHVAVYGENGLQRTFEVPRGQGNHWTVFFLRGGELVPASAIGGKPLDTPPAADGPR